MADCSIACVIVDEAVHIDGQAGPNVDIPLSDLTARSSTFREALETADGSSKFSVVAPAGFFQLWLNFVQTCQGPTKADAMKGQSTEDVLMILQVSLCKV